MNAKERLRAFLEQRREMGETEFVLDSLGLDDVLRVIGARSPASGAAPTAEDSRPGRPESSNWRDALTPAGGSPTGKGTPSDSRTPTPTPSVTRPSLGSPAEGVPGNLAPHEPSISSPRSRPTAQPTNMPDTPSSVTSEGSTLAPGLVVGSATREIFGAGQSPWATLDDIAKATTACTLCTLYSTAKQAVPGHGNPNADFVCVGEAPGASEDEQGVPFVGQAGQLLTKILAAIDLTREDVFIVNVLKHRPPGNRNPLPDEVAACSPYLLRQIELLRPKVILALGTFAAQTLLQTKETIGKLRGRIHRYYGVPLIVTYHPAALLRNPSWKRPTWEDVQLARKLHDRSVEA